MSIIIGRGSAADPAALNLYTTANRNRIENQRSEEDLPYETLQASLKFVRSVSATARCRSLTAMYNCVGLVFASRRTEVDAKHLPMILRDDGYRKIPEANAVEGDVVVYLRNNAPQHVGIIHQLDRILGFPDIWVLSQWGQCGEYIHRMKEVPSFYGDVTEFWSERRPA